MVYGEIEQTQYLSTILLLNRYGSFRLNRSNLCNVMKLTFKWDQDCFDYHFNLYGLEIPELERFYQ